MMRRIFSGGAALLFLGLFLVALMLLVPLRMVLSDAALDRAGLAARDVRGSIWSGRLSGVQFGGAMIGDLDTRLSPLGLFAGEMRLAFQAVGDPAIPFEGRIALSPRSTALAGARLTLPMAGLMDPIPVESLRLDDVEGRFSGGKCVGAEGRIQANIAGSLPGLSLPGNLSGNLRCEDDALVMPLQSQSGMEKMTLRLRQDGRFRMELTVRPSDAIQDSALLAMGFRKVADGYLFSQNGQF